MEVRGVEGRAAALAAGDDDRRKAGAVEGGRGGHG